MRLLDGRVEDYLLTRSGKRIYFGTFGSISIGQPGIAELMIRQDETGEVTVSVVHDPAAGLTFEQVADAVRVRVRDQLGFELAMRVVPIDRVPLTAGGKAQMIRSAYRPPGPPA
jgi:hypothetical protein